MTELKTKALRIVKCKKGETLVESVVSFLLFSILMMAVAAMIVTSLKITGLYTAEANAQQVSANVGILENAPVSAGHIFTITGDGIDDVEVDVELSQEGNLKAFYPEVT